MYNLSTLLNNLRQAYEKNPTEETSLAMQIHIAMALSSSIPIPKDQNCTSSEAWLMEGGAVREFLNDLNEEFIIDLETITKLVRDNYRQRFNLVYHPEKEQELLLAQTRKNYEDMQGNDMLVDVSFNIANFEVTRAQVNQGLKLAALNIQEKNNRVAEGRE